VHCLLSVRAPASPGRRAHARPCRCATRRLTAHCAARTGQARGLRDKVRALEDRAGRQDEQLAALRRASAGNEGDPALAAGWPAAARSAVSALEAQAANLRQRLGEREARIASLEETVRRLRAQQPPAAGAGAPADRQAPAVAGQAGAVAGGGAPALEAPEPKVRGRESHVIAGGAAKQPTHR